MNTARKFMIGTTNLTRMFTALLIFGIAVSAPQLFASAPWTASASTGSVDESDLSIVSLHSGRVYMKSSAPAESTINVRYNIVGLERIATSGLSQGFTLQTRYRDNGTGARVRLQVKRYDENGSITTIHTFDSNNFPTNSNFQVRSSAACFEYFNFDNNSYFIDAEITKSSTKGLPALEWIQIKPNYNCIQ